jgi:hypothetical protein
MVVRQALGLRWNAWLMHEILYLRNFEWYRTSTNHAKKKTMIRLRSWESQVRPYVHPNPMIHIPPSRHSAKIFHPAHPQPTLTPSKPYHGATPPTLRENDAQTIEKARNTYTTFYGRLVTWHALKAIWVPQTQ